MKNDAKLKCRFTFHTHNKAFHSVHSFNRLFCFVIAMFLLLSITFRKCTLLLCLPYLFFFFSTFCLCCSTRNKRKRTLLHLFSLNLYAVTLNLILVNFSKPSHRNSIHHKFVGNIFAKSATFFFFICFTFQWINICLGFSNL